MLGKRTKSSLTTSDVKCNPSKPAKIFLVGMLLFLPISLLANPVGQWLEISSAIAQTESDPRFEAGELFSQGRFLFDRKKFAEALNKFQESLRLFKQIGDRQAEAKVISLIAEVYKQQSQFDKAIDSYQQSIAIYEQIENWEAATDLRMTIGDIYYDRAQYANALEQFQQDLDLVNRIARSPNNNSNFTSYQQGKIYQRIGATYIALKEYDRALEAYQQALKYLGNNGLTFNGLGLVYRALGQPEKAKTFFQQAIANATGYQANEVIAVARRNLEELEGRTVNSYEEAITQARNRGDRKAEANAIYNLAFFYNKQQQYREALQFYRQALTIYQEIGDRNGEAITLHELGFTSSNLEQFDAALPFYDRALEIYRSLANRQGEATVLHNIGFTYGKLQQFDKALAYYQQAAAIEQALGQRESEVITLRNMAMISSQNREYYQRALAIYQELGDRKGELEMTEAIAYLRKPEGSTDEEWTRLETELQERIVTLALSVGQLNQQRLEALANFYYRNKQHQRAIVFLQQALANYRQATERSLEPQFLEWLAFFFDKQEQYSQAAELYQQALNLHRNGKTNVEQEIKILRLLGVAYYKQGEFDRALQSYQEAWIQLKNIPPLQGTPRYPQLGYQLNEEGLLFEHIGDVLAAQNRPELAIIFYKQAVNNFEVYRNNPRYISFGQEKYFLDSHAKTYRSLATLLLDRNRVMEGLLILDLLKVEELKDFLKDVKETNSNLQGIELLSEEKQFFDNLKPTPSLNLNTFLISSPVGELVQQLRQTAASQNLQLAAYRDLQTRLKAFGQKAALFYPLVLEDRLELVLFIDNDPPIHRTVKISKTQLEKAIENFRREVTDPISDAIRQPARELYSWMIQPLIADLEQHDIKTLIYAPDGKMRYLPIAALYDGKQWLIEKYQINYITALSLTNLNPQTLDRPRILAAAFTEASSQIKVGNKEFSFNAIPEARNEVETLAQNFPGTTILLGADFSRETINPDRLNRYNIIHLATHGQLVSGDPRESFILLNKNEYITLEQIQEWKLSNVTLVVLSACQTALGDRLTENYAPGIEIIGFGYQLQQAQVRATIASLWSINDVGTKNLMSEFYAGLQKGNMNSVEALRQAQIALIKNGTVSEQNQQGLGDVNSASTDTSYLSHPYYWAPFILIGNGL